MEHNKGVTITSVLVATALAGVVAAVVSQLITNQSKVMRTLTLREERENLLKHYRNTLISGWDHTLTNGCSDLYNRDGNVALPSAGLKVKSDDLYSSTSAADGYWEVKFSCGNKSGSIFASDKYDSAGGGFSSETHREVTLTVNFLKDSHPHISTKLAERQEKFYMHQQNRLAGDTDCRIEENPTRINTLASDIDQVPKILWGPPSSGYLPPEDTGQRPPLKGGGAYALYKGEGAVIQYDFNTNYTKCSQVPLVREGACAHDAAIVGFWGTMERTTPTLCHDSQGASPSTPRLCPRQPTFTQETVTYHGFPYVYGNYVCSHDDTTGMPAAPAVPRDNWYHPKIDPLSGTPPNNTMRLITAYVGTGAGTPTNLNNFNTDGCQHNSTPSNHTYVNYIDGKGTAYCQTDKHVIQDNIFCPRSIHPGVPAASHAGRREPSHIRDFWGDDSDERNYQRNLENLCSSGSRPVPCPPLPAPNTGIFSRVERDTCWVLGNGSFIEFYRWNDADGMPGKLDVPPSHVHGGCSRPGFQKGLPGPTGEPGRNGSYPGPPGPPGTITWNPIPGP